MRRHALARESQAMIVIGDKQSSNTKRLAQICAEYCKQVSLIDSTDQLQKADFTGRSCCKHHGGRIDAGVDYKGGQ